MSELSEGEAENVSAYVTKSKQRAYIKIETLCGDTVPIIQASLKEVYGKATLDRSTVQWWHKRFRERRVSTVNNLWSGCPCTAFDNTSIAFIAIVFNEDWCVMVREMDAETGIPQTTIYSILIEH